MVFYRLITNFSYFFLKFVECEKCLVNVVLVIHVEADLKLFSS